MRGLLAEAFHASLTDGASGGVRETVSAVAELLVGRESGAVVNLTELAARLGVAKSTAKSRVDRALRGGWLVNDECRRTLNHVASCTTKRVAQSG